jgi:hypothetical protein
MENGEIILKDTEVDKPYIRVGSPPNWIAGSNSLKEKIIQTVGELK